jgi:hypothetical protein
MHAAQSRALGDGADTGHEAGTGNEGRDGVTIEQFHEQSS